MVDAFSSNMPFICSLRHIIHESTHRLLWPNHMGLCHSYPL